MKSPLNLLLAVIALALFLIAAVAPAFLEPYRLRVVAAGLAAMEAAILV